MKTSRSASIIFGVFWLAIIIVFSFGSNDANGLVIYALLSTFAGLKQSYLIRPNDPKSAATALTFAAALNYGPVGGAIVGATVVLAQNIDLSSGTSNSKLMAISVSGATAGAATGLVYVMCGKLALISPFGHVALMLLAAVVCYAIMAVYGLVTSRQYIYHSLSERLKQNSPLSTELAVGMALAAVIRLIFAIFNPGALLLLVMPMIYLARQSLDAMLSTDKPSVSIKNSKDRLANLYLSIVYSLVAAIDARDRFARTHTTNVTKLALIIARKLNLSPSEMEGLKMAALFHDIGKLWVPEHILLKPGRLNPDQFAKMQHHPALAQKIINKVDFPWPIGQIVRAHHERWDGTGYPDRLKGEQIPLSARILCMADTYDAMTSKRSYRSSTSVQETVQYIRDSAGTHFDPAVIRAFEQVIADGALPGANRNMISETTPDSAAPSAQTQHKGPAGQPDDDASRTSSEFIAMFEIAQTANTSLNLEKMLYLLAGKIKSMISCVSCVISLREKESDQLAVRIALGANSQYFDGGRTTIGQGQTGLVAETGKGIITSYDEHDVMLPHILEPWAKLDEWIELKSVMIVPMVSGDGVLGTINLYHSKANAFTEEDFRLLTVIAPQVGKAIQNALLFKQTTESAMTDVLTGLNNARHLFIRLDQELNRAKRLNKPVSLLGLDLDNFKAINDNFGHQQGDLVLREMAQLFLTQVRDYDLVCRYGGDEFVIVLPDADKAQALETARRIEMLVDSHKPYKNNNMQIRIGVSIGVASYPEDGQDVRSLIARSDVNMYMDKKRRKGSSPTGAEKNSQD